MKNQIFLLFAFVFTGLSVSNASNIIINSENKTELKVIENTNFVLRLKNNISSISLSEVETENGFFVKAKIPGYGASLMVGDPELPVLNNLIEIPYGATVETEIIRSSYKDYDLSVLGFSGTIIPSHGPISKDIYNQKPIEYILNAQTYSSNSFIGQENVSVEILGTMRGVRIGRLKIAPVQYNPTTRTIRVFDELVINITFKNGDITLTESSKKNLFSPFYENIHSKLINYKPLSPDELITSSPVTYVIISDPMFYDALQPFIQWKTQKGFRVITGYTDDPEVGNTTESIKAYLENLYNNPPEGYNPQSFILFVGDVDQIPSFSSVQGFHLTDLYYAEYSGDIFPECYYGRFSANSPDELEPQIAKTVEYEKYQFPNPSYLDSVMLVAGVAAGYDTLWGNGQIYYMADNYLNQSNGIFPHIYTPPFSPDTNFTDMMIQKFSNGVSFVNYTGHCSSFGFSSPPLNIGHIASFSNEHKYPLVVGNCCSSASFFSTCFGEEIVRVANKGALAYIGAANSTYWDEDYWWMVGFKDISSNPPYDPEALGLIDRWLHQNNEPVEEWYITIGQMPVAGNLAVTQAGSSIETYYWEVYNLLGDPSVMIYVPEPSLPSVAYEPSISPGTETFTVNTEPYMYAAVSMNGVLHGAASADENGVAEIDIFTPFTEPGIADVVVTGQNRQPFFGTVQVEEAQGVFVLLQSFEIDDSNGNNDGKADAAENILLNVTLFNFGNTASNNLLATLSTADSNITITENTNNWPSLNPGASQLKNAAFSFDVGEFFVNGHIAEFNLEITDGTEIWNSGFSVTLHSLITELPELQTTEPIAGIIIYPNPFKTQFTVKYELTETAEVSISILDLMGKQYSTIRPAYRQTAGKHKIVLNAGDMRPGVYLCKIQSGNHTVIKRIVLTR
jgi:hypothetical protein